MNDTVDPTIRTEATVTVKDTVDGTVKRRTRGPNKRPTQKVETLTADPRIMDTAKGLLGKHRELVIVADDEVWIVNKGCPRPSGMPKRRA